MNLKKILNQKLNSYKRVAVLGIGSDLRGDDEAGLLVAQQLEKAFKGSKKVKVFIGATAPENLTGVVKRYKPTHIVTIDSSDTASKPGTINIIDPDDVGGVSFSTHQMPIKVLIDYFKSSLDCKFLIVGIQPKDTAFGGPVSKAVKDSTKQLSKALTEVLRS